MMIPRNEGNWKRQRICCLDRGQMVMDNTTAKVSCFARAYHFVNNKTHIFADITERFFADYNRSTPEHPMAAPVGVDYVYAVRE